MLLFGPDVEHCYLVEKHGHESKKITTLGNDIDMLFNLGYQNYTFTKTTSKHVKEARKIIQNNDDDDDDTIVLKCKFILFLFFFCGGSLYLSTIIKIIWILFFIFFGNNRHGICPLVMILIA